MQSIYATFERDISAESLEYVQREVYRWRNTCDGDDTIGDTLAQIKTYDTKIQDTKFYLIRGHRPVTTKYNITNNFKDLNKSIDRM